MKRLVQYILFSCYALSVLGCVRDSLYSDLSSDRQIKLTGHVPSPIVATRASGIDYIYDYFEPTGNAEFSFLRWNQGQSTDPSEEEYTDNVLAATLGDPVPSDQWRRYVQFNDLQYFDTDNSIECGFAGCYPSVENANWVKKNGSFIDNNRVMTYDIDGKTDVMFSDFKKGNYSTGIEPLTFKHALCLYKVYAYAVDEDSKTEWGKIDAVTFMNLPEQLFVTLPEDMTDPEAQVGFSYSPKKANTSEYVKQHIILDQDLDKNGDGVVDAGKLNGEKYPISDNDGEGLALPAGFASNNLVYVGALLGGAPDEVLGINVSMDNPDIVAESAVSIARDFQPGYTYNIILRFSTHGIVNASVTVEDWPDQPIVVPDSNDSVSAQLFFTNLSRYGTANSYVVSSANMGYAIDCTVKGNGVNTLTDWNNVKYNLQDTDPTIDSRYINKIEVIWSDVVLLRTGEGTWEAADDEEHDEELIEIVSETPVDGKILFEVKGFDSPEDYRLKYKGNALIGAYDATDNLIWSWHIWVTDKPLNLNYGNGYTSQDRNLGAVSSNASDFALNHFAVSGLCYQWGRKDPFNPDPCADDDHQHSYIMDIISGQATMRSSHKKPTTFYASEGNWCSDGNDYQWGYISEQDEMYKTMYDPCPPGYRVNGNPLWEIQSNESLDPPVGSGNNSGYWFGIGNRITIYYPSSLYFDEGGDIIDTGDVYQYSANPGYLFHYPPENVGQSLSQVYRAGAYPVRCVLENSKKAVTDLSREQSANCYIVENSGYYKFNARVPGNAVGSLSVQSDEGGFTTVSIHGGVGTTLSDVAKVDVLWWQGDLKTHSAYMSFVDGASHTKEEYENACPIKLMDYDPVNESCNLDEKGYAYFLVEKDKLQNANIILAGFDISGNIRWTWHIWMLPEGFDLVRFGQYNVMDRNVGATYAPKTLDDVTADNVFTTYGFYYQWGRKDPFVPPLYHYCNDANSKSSISSKWIRKDPVTGEWTINNSSPKVSGPVTIVETIGNPTTFYTNGSGPCQNTYTDQDISSHLWGYTGLTGTASYSSAKTMWDPCPPGYKQIDHTTLESANLWNSNNADAKDLEEVFANEFGLLITSLTEIEDLGRVNTDESGFWLPFSRGISPTGEYITVTLKAEGQLHTLCPYNYNGIFGFGASKDRSRSLLYSAGVITHNNDHYQSCGKTVRCQKE